MYEIVKTKKGYDITLTRGDSLPLQLTLKKNNESYMPGSEAYIRFAMKARYNDDTPVLVKEIPVDTLQLIFIPEDTKDLPMKKTYVYDIELTDESGYVATFIEGRFTVGEEVM